MTAPEHKPSEIGESLYLNPNSQRWISELCCLQQIFCRCPCLSQMYVKTEERKKEKIKFKINYVLHSALQVLVHVLSISWLYQKYAFQLRESLTDFLRRPRDILLLFFSPSVHRKISSLISTVDELSNNGLSRHYLTDL